MSVANSGDGCDRRASSTPQGVRVGQRSGEHSTSHELRGIIQFVDKRPTPSLLPIFRSQQQAELLALILGDPSTEHSLVELADRTGIPYASVHREVERAVASGLVTLSLIHISEPTRPY